jgi:hypothetical protein
MHFHGAGTGGASRGGQGADRNRRENLTEMRTDPQCLAKGDRDVRTKVTRC